MPRTDLATRFKIGMYLLKRKKRTLLTGFENFLFKCVTRPDLSRVPLRLLVVIVELEITALDDLLPVVC